MSRHDNEINIDFTELDKCLKSMKEILGDLDEPDFRKLEFWTSGESGSGYVHDKLSEFGAMTVGFYMGVFKLINNTIKYLNDVKKMKTTDEKISEALK